MILNENATLIIGLTAGAGALLGVMAAMLAYLQARRLSYYSEELNRAMLSDMRESYERQMSRLTEQLVATEDRWREVNHLILSGQTAQSTYRKRGSQAEYIGFLGRFGIGERDMVVDPKLVFVLTPFSKDERHVFDLIAKTCGEVGFRTVRGDEEFAHGDILGQIMRTMVKARIVVANITSRNANVFYELGLAHALGKPTLLISKVGIDHPFDVRGIRIIMYYNEGDLTTLLKDAILKMVIETDLDRYSMNIDGGEF